MEKKKRLSPFSKEFWIEKGYSDTDADFQRNSIRPIRPEFWLKRGHSQEESIHLAEKTKKENNIKGAKKSSERPKEEIFRTSVRRVEYWQDKGFSLEESKKIISERQESFSLKTCIEKYGKEKGLEVWRARQELWQNSLKKLDQGVLNKKKNAIKKHQEETDEEFIQRMLESRNIKIFADVDSLKNFHGEIIKKSPLLMYSGAESYLKTKIQKCQFALIEEDQIKEALSEFFRTSSNGEFFSIQRGRHTKNRKVAEGLLRSSMEMYFYDEWAALVGSSLVVDKKYPDSNMRYDFLLPTGEYIEICPNYEVDDIYRQKMDAKQSVFNSILLKTKEEIDEFIISYKNNN